MLDNDYRSTRFDDFELGVCDERVNEMKLAQATAYTKLRDEGLRVKISEQYKVGLELAKEIFAEAEEREQPFLYHSPETWARKWLPSKRFRLMRLPLNAAAMPCEPKVDNLVLKKIHAMETKPIVVDYNKNQVGSSMHGFVPQVIVIDGKHRFKAAALRGETHIMAWVGELATESIHAFGGGGGGPAPERTEPAAGAKLVAQGSSRQETKLSNRPGTYATGLVKYPTFKNAAGKVEELNVKKILSAYKRAKLMKKVSAEISLMAKAPPGWEGTVKKLKDHPGIDNPYALTWWMKEQGYTPGGEGKGK